LTLPESHQPGREDLSHFAQPLVGRHELRRQRIAARKAVIETLGGYADVLVHPAAVDLLAK
jgi:hypothetical protein